MQGYENSPRGTFVGKETEGIRFERNEREVTRSGDRLKRLGFKGEHTARHVNGGGDEQIALPAPLMEDFLDFDRALKGVTRLIFGKYIVFRHTPKYQVVARDLVFIFRWSKGIHVPAGDNDRLGADPVQAPGFLQAVKHVLINRCKRNESAGRNHAAGQDNDRIVRLHFGGLEERRITRFKRIAKQITDGTAVQGDDQTESR